MNNFGENLRLSVSGTRHGPCFLATLDGIPAGEKMDVEEAWRAATRRVSGMSETGADPLQEEIPAVISGIAGGVSTGEAIAAMLHGREDMQSGDKNLPRPGHGDLAALAKYGFRDFSGGAYSGRFGYALGFAGALCAQILERRGVSIKARLAAVGEAFGEELDFGMRKELLDARGTGDSVGCVVECVCTGVPAGLGSPVFGGLESRIASIIFSIPGVKGVEFGMGFGFAHLRGSAANDKIVLREERLTAETNHSGGVDAGVTTGLPLVVRAAMRPTPDIGREQRTVDLDTGAEASLRFRGRHDPCLGPRAVPAVEGAAAFCLLDAMLDSDNRR